MKKLAVGLVALVTLFLAACSSSGAAPSSSWTPTPVPTSGWSGGAAEQAAVFGTLERGKNGCLGVSPGTVLRWPEGFTGRTSSSGVVEVLNAEDQVVARTGHPVNLGGGQAPGTLTGPCLDGYQVFDIQGIVPTLAP
jgi:hypothetical protein